MIRAKVIGACGYGGVGISELLAGHPEAEIAALVDVENTGHRISELYPHLEGHIDLTVVGPADPKATEPVDVVFTATPDRVGMKLAPTELDRGSRLIDYSGDFRFNTEDAYAEYANRIGLDSRHASPELLGEAVYGLAEFHREEIASATRLVGNPGCFAVSCILGLGPAVKCDLIDQTTIICDCKTGVSGAGRKPNAAFHYPARYENMNAYRLSGHQHVCEIERELGLLADGPLTVTFTAHVVPLCRGIMSTLYAKLDGAKAEQEIVDVYRDFYEKDLFVNVYDGASAVGSPHVRCTNRCNLVVSVDARNNQLRVISYIDNLMKGQSGSALQNMNLLFGFPEDLGMDRPGMYP